MSKLSHGIGKTPACVILKLNGHEQHDGAGHHNNKRHWGEIQCNIHSAI